MRTSLDDRNLFLRTCTPRTKKQQVEAGVTSVFVARASAVEIVRGDVNLHPSLLHHFMPSFHHASIPSSPRVLPCSAPPCCALVRTGPHWSALVRNIHIAHHKSLTPSSSPAIPLEKAEQPPSPPREITLDLLPDRSTIQEDTKPDISSSGRMQIQTRTQSRRGEVPPYAPEWAPGLPGKWTYAFLDPVSARSMRLNKLCGGRCSGTLTGYVWYRTRKPRRMHRYRSQRRVWTL
jgi:hypothetical protein